VVLAERENVQAELIGKHGVAEDLGHPVHWAVQSASALIALQVAERQDAKLH
jgi:hypothetical protein